MKKPLLYDTQYNKIQFYFSDNPTQCQAKMLMKHKTCSKRARVKYCIVYPHFQLIPILAFASDFLKWTKLGRNYSDMRHFSTTATLRPKYFLFQLLCRGRDGRQKKKTWKSLDLGTFELYSRFLIWFQISCKWKKYEIIWIY